MKNWLKVIFRRRLRGLLVIRKGNIAQFGDEEARKAHMDQFRQYARDQRLAVLFVLDTEAVKAIQLGPDTRLLVSRKHVRGATLAKLCSAPPGSIIRLEDEEMAHITVLGGENHELPERTNTV